MGLQGSKIKEHSPSPERTDPCSQLLQPDDKKLIDERLSAICRQENDDIFFQDYSGWIVIGFLTEDDAFIHRQTNAFTPLVEPLVAQIFERGPIVTKPVVHLKADDGDVFQQEHQSFIHPKTHGGKIFQEPVAEYHCEKKKIDEVLEKSTEGRDKGLFQEKFLKETFALQNTASCGIQNSRRISAFHGDNRNFSFIAF